MEQSVARAAHSKKGNLQISFKAEKNFLEYFSVLNVSAYLLVLMYFISNVPLAVKILTSYILNILIKEIKQYAKPYVGVIWGFL